MAIERITRAMFNITLCRALKGLEDDPKRTVRNVVDLALGLARGRFKLKMLGIAQVLLQNPDSAYYRLAEETVKNVDRQNLKTFGINLCYEGCTAGAKKIRDNEQKLGFNIPWVLSFGDGDRNWTRRVRCAVGEAHELGISVFAMLGEDVLSEDSLEIFGEFPQCAFLALSPADVAAEFASRASRAYNLCVSADCSDRAAFERAAAELKRAKKLFCAHVALDDPSLVERELSEDAAGWLEKTGAAAKIIIPRFSDGDALERLRDGVIRFRMDGQHSFLMADGVSDLMDIDRIISDDPFAITFLSDGSARVFGGRTDESCDLNTHALCEILSRAGAKG